LRQGRLAGAAFDVFESEPPGAPSGAVSGDAPNLILTPHIAGLTAESNQRVSEVTAAGVLRVLRRGLERLVTSSQPVSWSVGSIGAVPAVSKQSLRLPAAPAVAAPECVAARAS
jgi:hypothetical protein